MRKLVPALATLTISGAIICGAAGQAPPPAPPNPPKASPAPPPPAPVTPSEFAPPSLPAPTAVAATVNGQPIMELAVYRGLKQVPPEHRAAIREDIINSLVENTLIDQHLTQLKVAVDNKDVDAKLKQVKDEIQKEGATFDKVMKDLALTEAELRSHVAEELRWEKFAAGQATDKALRELFDNSKEIFDGTVVRARHILLAPAADDAKAAEEAKKKLLQLKKQLEQQIAAAKPPTATDPLEIEKARTKTIETAFSEMAAKESMCPSKSQGGDLGFFPRAGSMVEPFAKAAFALKPFQISDVVTTQFGQHLILVIERRPGKQIKFEDVKDVVKEVYGDRLREDLASRLREKAKIAVNPPSGPK